MKVLLDSCVWNGARAEIAAAGHDVVCVGDWGADPGDAEILRTAYLEGRVLVTLDKDFGELATVKGARHAGIMRLTGFRARDQGPVVAQILSQYGQDLREGALVTVEPDRVRIRPAASVSGPDR